MRDNDKRHAAIALEQVRFAIGHTKRAIEAARLNLSRGYTDPADADLAAALQFIAALAPQLRKAEELLGPGLELPTD